MIRKYQCLEIKQNSTIFYVVSIDALSLQKMCKISIRNLESSVLSDVYQRSLNYSRARQIKEFVERERGIMPPAIVLNSLKPIVVENNMIIIDDEKDQFFIIDGQHRIAGVNLAKKNDFHFPVVIMNNVDQSFQDELFISINNEQKRVNPTIRFRIKANDYAFTPENAVRRIAYFLNEYHDAPFHGLLITTDDGKYKRPTEMLSLSTFSNILLSYIYDEKDYYQIKDILIENKCVEYINGALNQFDDKYDNKILWKLYKNDSYKIIAKILYNYFNAIKNIFIKSWGNKDYLITKTTGYNALMLLFKDVYIYCSHHNNNFSLEHLSSLLSPLKRFDGQITLKDFGVGKSASATLYKLFYEYVFQTNPSHFSVKSLEDLYDDSSDD